MQVYKEEIRVKGKPVMVDAITVSNQVVIITGKFIKTARIKDEWYENVEEPESIIRTLENIDSKPDSFIFSQRFPETEPMLNYYTEWDNVAAIHIKSFDHWWKKQIPKQTRRAIKKAEENGVKVEVVEFNDELVKGIRDIFNESSLRQGKPFWHYGKNFKTVKKEMSDRLNRAEFIGAYYNDELIGFIKLLYGAMYARTVQIISKIKDRDKYPTNLLIAKAVEICCKKGIPYLVYGKFDYGKTGSRTLTDFKRHNGFQKIDLPRYYIPLTIKGKIILKLKLHHGIKGILPEKTINWLLDLRAKWYARKYRNAKIN